MNLTVQQVWDMTFALSAIINERRPMPQRGKFLLARMHSRLKSEFDIAAAQRDKLIDAYDHREPDSDVFSVPVDKMPEFIEAWSQVASVIVDVDVTPIKLADLELPGVNGAIEGGELVTLGELIAE